MPFCFRLTIHFVPGDKIESDAESLPIRTADPGTNLRIKTGSLGTPIRQQSKVVLLGGPYESEPAASSAAQSARNAVLLWALETGRSIDLGSERGGVVLTDAGLEWFSKKIGKPVAREIHGINVYECNDELVFVSSELNANLGMSPSQVTTSIAKWYDLNPHLSQKQMVAVELFCASRFDVPSRSRFLTLMTAIEALLEPATRDSIAQQAVDAMKAIVESADVDSETRQSLRSSLVWLRSESIGQTGRRLARELLGSRTYGAARLTAERFFAECYSLRSTIVHEGRAQPDADILEASNSLYEFVGDLLKASVGVALAPQQPR